MVMHSLCDELVAVIFVELFSMLKGTGDEKADHLNCIRKITHISVISQTG